MMVAVNDVMKVRPWVVEMCLVKAKGARKHPANCGWCSADFVRSKDYAGALCPDCLAAELDRANLVGLARLHDRGQQVQRMRYVFGSPYITADFSCQGCGQNHSVEMHRLISWECPALACFQNRVIASKAAEIKALAGRHSFKVENIVPPTKRVSGDAFIKVGFECCICGAKSQRALSEIKAGVPCACRFESISRGQAEVRNYLENQNVKFVMECRLDKCGIDSGMRFDFFLPDSATAIEYDGQQHYRPVEYFGGFEGFIKRQENDSIKDALAREHGISLIRIPYHVQDIPSFLADRGIGQSYVSREAVQAADAVAATIA